MEKQVHPPKIGAIGTNVPKNTEEKEEDFLETIFSCWRNGKTMRLTDFAMETGENKTHLRSLGKTPGKPRVYPDVGGRDHTD